MYSTTLGRIMIVKFPTENFVSSFTTITNDIQNMHSKHLMLMVKVPSTPLIFIPFIIFAIKSHLLTEKVKTVLKEFVEKTQGSQVNYAYCTAFQALLSDMETIKKIYLYASDGSKTREISKEKFTFSAALMSQVTPLEIDILFSLSKMIDESQTVIYSDLQSLAPEQYMKKVTKRVVDIKMVESPEERNGFIEFLEFMYRFSIGSLSGVLGEPSKQKMSLKVAEV